MMERRRVLGGSLPRRVVRSKPLKLPGDDVYRELAKGSGKNKVATTMAAVRLLRDWMKDPEIGKRLVPIAPDEYRTFGMDSMFPSAKVYNPGGQQYEAVDRKLLLAYKESTQGQLLHEGISEAGAMASATAAGSAYSTHGEPMIPFYIFYSMFGFQRTGDSIWAMADQLARGFLIGATAGRTTLTGEGLQHADGHSPLLAATNPAVVHYDPAYAYEVAHVMRSGLERMYGDGGPDGHGENVIFYMTVYNEPVSQPAQPDDVDVEGILKGIHRVGTGEGEGPRVQLLASGVGMPWIERAAELLREDWGVTADLWSVTSWNELARDAVAAEDAHLLNPDHPAAHAVRHREALGQRRPVRRRLRLHGGGAAPDRALGARRLLRARGRRLRLRRHPPGRAAVLPHRRRVGRRPHPAGPRRRRRDRPGPGVEGAGPVPHRRPDRRRRRRSRRVATRSEERAARRRGDRAVDREERADGVARKG